MIEWAEHNFSAGTGDINGIIVATGNTIKAVKNNFTSALNFHIESSLADGDKLSPDIANRDFEIIFELGASAMLHLVDGLITRSAISKETGINEKQLSHYLTGHRTARQEQNKRIAVGIKKLSKKLDELSELV